ncbi:MAG: hypothetical protein ACOC5I_02275 [Gemmatimonadota bacterium]
MLVHGRTTPTDVVVPPPKGHRALVVLLVVLHLESDDVESLLDDLRRLGYEAGPPSLDTRSA